MPYYIFASTYGSSSYNSNNYNGSAATATAPATSTTTTTQTPDQPATTAGVLANTGFSIVLAITLACFIIFMALVIRFWKRPARLSANK